MLLQAVVALAAGMVLFLFLVGLASISLGAQYGGRIFSGVSIAGVDVSGLTPDQAAGRLAQQINFPEAGKIVFKDGAKVWIARPGELGFILDAETSAQAAYLLGRQGNPLAQMVSRLDAWYTGSDLPPLMVYDARQARRYLEGVAAEIDRPTIEASLQVKDLNVVVTPGQVGRKLDIQASLAPLEAQMLSLTDGLFTLEVREDPPAILDASEQGKIAQNILSAPLVLEMSSQIGDSNDTQGGSLGPWTLSPQKLSEWLIIERVDTPQGTQYQVGLDEGKLQTYLEGIAPLLTRQASNARFTFNDDTKKLEVIQSSVTGRALDLKASLEAINSALLKGQHTLALAMSYTQPQVSDDATAEKLGIKELVSAYTSYFRGSSSERIQNIKTAASRFHGVLVPPQAVFSMADIMGDVSLDTGYAEALIIFGNRTIKGVGGGVCQVSTTLFRTVFFGGFPVEERHPHAYRVGYYEQTARGVDADLAGLDATVFVPVVDFKFKNDTTTWLLMETYVSAKAGTLTWKFYSTSDGRKVDWSTTGPQNKVEPPDPSYEENPDLASGVIKQVDWAAEGADITISRTVTREDEILFGDQFTTHYLPWRAVFQYGPGTDIPGKKNRD